MPVTENMEARVTARCYTVEGLQHAIMGGITGIEHGNLIDTYGDGQTYC